MQTAQTPQKKKAFQPNDSLTVELASRAVPMSHASVTLADNSRKL